MNALSIQNVSVYYAQHQALKNINLEIEEGAFLGILGPNGGGKSTLIKAIIGSVPYSGTIKIFGKEQNYTALGYMPQSSGLNRGFPIDVLEVCLGANLHKKWHFFYHYTKAMYEEAMEYLELFGIGHLAHRSITELSGGEFQKLLLARTLLTKPKLLLLDEPTANIDPQSSEHIFEVLAKFNKEITIIMVTHDLSAIASCVKSIACLSQTLIYHGEPKLNAEILTKMYGCPVDLIAHGHPHRVLPYHVHDEETGECYEMDYSKCHEYHDAHEGHCHEHSSGQAKD